MLLYDRSIYFLPKGNVLFFLLSLLYSFIEKYSINKRTFIRHFFLKGEFK